PAGGHEQGVAGARAQDVGAALAQVAFDPVQGFRAQGDQAVLAALAHDDAHHAVAQAQVLDVQADQFADPQAGGVQGFQHGAVAQPEGGADVGRGQQGFDLGLGQGLGKAGGLAGAAQAQAGILGAQAAPQRPQEEAPQGGEAAVGGAGLGLPVLGRQPGLDVLAQRGFGRAAVLGTQPAAEGAQVAPVGGQGVVR